MGKIIVTGATGFIGSRLMKLCGESHELIGISRKLGRDVLDPKVWESFLDENISAIIHLAAVTLVPRSWQYPAEYMELNLKLSLPILEFARKKSVRIVNVSTYLYGSPQKIPVSEESPVSATNPYAFSKKIAEDTCLFYQRFFNVPVVLVRPFNIYGPGLDEAYLIPTLMKQMKSQNEIEVQDATPRRDYLHVDDCVRALILLAKMSSPPSVVNLCSGRSHSIAEIVGELSKVSGRDFKLIDLKKTRPQDPPDTCGSSILTRQGLWKPEIKFEDGLKQLWDLNV